ncbi:guanyl-specific ribonuclease F1 [Rhizoctonia solani AG-3 Rhs1AP]|uniref:Guanyl-specific ribonuclease F1 n=2 Tax=Rhizoctonia solani AG-3 TaxID=1086053 RepID=A0A074S4N3_9AGAM|nr:guanyl-specific ribonuclease F1 [Rhizoctonia solani AG-3 Rhs1AP]KEP52545.1 guanyl-specific ribonuclease F1 [Rhizoctonia solani 123E]
MVALLQTFLVLGLSALALAVPTPIETPDLFKRTISGVQAADCGKTQFTASQVQSAAEAAASRVAEGSQVGRNKYPHRFNNREGFQFLPDCNAPFYEFPIFTSKVYTGGSPGPDRVVIGSASGEDAAFCGVMTHTGAPGRNNFLQCEVEG